MLLTHRDYFSHFYTPVYQNYFLGSHHSLKSWSRKNEEKIFFCYTFGCELASVLIEFLVKYSSSPNKPPKQITGILTANLHRSIKSISGSDPPERGTRNISFQSFYLTYSAKILLPSWPK